MEEETKEKRQEHGHFERDEDFASLYANNVILEASALDLKFIFGQLEQHTGEPIVMQHTAVAMPWVTAKLLSYYLQVLIADNESQNGKVKMPVTVLPPLSPRPDNATPRQQRVIELAQDLHHKLVADIAKPEE
jgi:hypothetical protein